MFKTYHPVSGEEMFLVTKDEKAIIDVALEFMKSHSSSEESGFE